MRKIRKSKIAKFYYHVTSLNLGKNKLFKPKRILGCDCREPDLERICVAPTISGCFAAIYVDGRKYNVYRTKKKVKAHLTYNVYDVRATGEKWLLSPTDFVLVASVDSKISRDLPESARGDENRIDSQQKDKEKIRKILKNGLKKQLVRVSKGYEIRL